MSPRVVLQHISLAMFLYSTAPQAVSTEDQLTTMKGLGTPGSRSEETRDIPEDIGKDNNEINSASMEKTEEPPSDQNGKSPSIKVEPTWDKRMNDFKSITFDLTQEAVNHYMNSEVMRILEAIKGLEYSPENMIKFKIWSNGIIPFFIDKFSYDKILSDKIRGYLDAISRLTGLKFVELLRPPADEMQRWVFFINRVKKLDCNNYDERWGTPTGIQSITIGYDCFRNGGFMASLILAMVSIPPQHASPDRDKFIRVFEENCLGYPDNIDAFVAVVPEKWLFHDIEYDFFSAGHYPFHKYTANGKATIKPREPVNIPVGEAKGLSFTDVYKIRRLYNAITSKQNKQHQLSNCQKVYKSRKDTGSVSKTPNLLISGNEPLENSEAPQEEGADVKDKNILKPIVMMAQLKVLKGKKIRLTTEDPLRWPDIQSDDV